MISDTAEMTIAAGARLVPAGVQWDAVKVSRHQAVRAIELLETPGAVAVDPSPSEPVLYFLVPPGTASAWDVPETTALGHAHVVLPPEHKEAPPGPYWLIPQRDGLTSVAALRKALAVIL
ncbi:hypothetical protein [Actinomadura coerulea]|uniref:hypothetical protein n=1 Tax=Actinomadura coerulea TaxID=46159 RepID=UPI003420C30B